MNIMESTLVHQALAHQVAPQSPHCQGGSIHGSSDSGNLSGNEHGDDGSIEKIQVSQHPIMRAGQKRSPAEIEEAVMRKKLRNRESAQRARDRQKARMRWLEEEVTRITGKNDQVMKENLLLRHVLEEQSAKINELVRRDDERRKKKTDTAETVKTEPVETTETKPKKKGLWRPGVEDDKDETATVVSATTSGVGTTTTTTPESLVQMRLNLPTQTATTPTLPYAAMLEQHSRAALPFYNLAGLTAAHGYNPLAPPTPLSNASFNR